MIESLVIDPLNVRMNVVMQRGASVGDGEGMLGKVDGEEFRQYPFRARSADPNDGAAMGEVNHRPEFWRDGGAQPGFEIRCCADDEITTGRKAKDRFFACDAAETRLILKNKTRGTADCSQHGRYRIWPCSYLNDREVFTLAAVSHQHRQRNCRDRLE